ncbi:MAG: DegT/DnrJ/EryC1/StrS family aminotransferase, partial [Candidatus Helarchaeota archaeon]
NYRMTEIQAAIGRVQLKKLDQMNALRIKKAKIYDDALDEIEGIEPPFVASYNKHVYNVYAPILNIDKLKVNKETFLNHLNHQYPVSKLIYPHPLYTEPLFNGIYKGERCPNVEKLSQRVLKLSLWPSIKEEEIRYSINKTKEVLLKFT